MDIHAWREHAAQQRASSAPFPGMPGNIGPALWRPAGWATDGFAAIPTTALDLPLVQRLRRSPRFRVRVPVAAEHSDGAGPSSRSAINDVLSRECWRLDDGSWRIRDDDRHADRLVGFDGRIVPKALRLCGLPEAEIEPTVISAGDPREMPTTEAIHRRGPALHGDWSGGVPAIHTGTNPDSFLESTLFGSTYRRKGINDVAARRRFRPR